MDPSLPWRSSAFRDLLLILSPVTEAVRPLRARAMLDFLQQPLLVAFLVLLPHLPLAVVIAELRLVDHGDAFLHRADRFADSTAATRLHIRVVQAVRGDVEAGVGAL